MSLNDDLDVIQITAPTVPQDIANLLEANGDFVDAVRGLITSLDSKREAATMLHEKVRNALAALQKSAEGQATALETALDAAENAVKAMIETLTSARDGIEDQAEKAVNEVGSLQSTLATAGDEAKSAQQDASAKMSALATGLAGDLEALRTAVGAAGGEADKLEAEIAGAGENAEEGVGELKSKFDAIEKVAPDYLSDTRSRRVEPPAEAMQQAVEGAMEELATRNAKLFTEVSGPTEEKGTDLQGVMEEVGTHEAGLAEPVMAAQEDLPGDREESDTLIEGLTEAREPLPGIVEAVRGAAELANIPW
jgi:chromosome segregation ATPase